MSDTRDRWRLSSILLAASGTLLIASELSAHSQTGMAHRAIVELRKQPPENVRVDFEDRVPEAAVLENVALESTRTIEIDEFVDRSEIESRYVIRPYYLCPDGKVGHTPSQ